MSHIVHPDNLVKDVLAQTCNDRGVITVQQKNER